jgi:putative tryptophan/tyrosine transport system substrate-binding protein
MVPRRTAVALAAASGAALTPRMSTSQQRGSGPPRIGLLSATDSSYVGVRNFHDRLRELGHVEGQTIVVEARFAERQLDRLPGLAAELVGMRVDLVAAVGAVTVRAVRQASATIPLVFTVVLDPVADGLVPNAEHPGGNTTGATSFDPAQPRAQMRLLKQIVPMLQRVAILGDAGVPELLDRANRAAAEAEGLRPQNIRLRGAAEDLDAVFAAIREERAAAVLGLDVPAVGLHARRIVALATAARLPTMYGGDSAVNGPMIAYGSSLAAAAGRMAGMVDRILKGARPGDLPIEVVTEHRMVVNLRVAREIGLTIPPEVLARADQVIE